MTSIYKLKGSWVLCSLIVLGACGTSGKKSVARLEKADEALRTGQQQLVVRISELSQEVTALRDQLEVFSLSRENRSNKKVSSVVSTPAPTSSSKSPDTDSSFADDNFLPVDPKTSSLPTVTLTNEDLARIDRKTQAIPIPKEELEEPSADQSEASHSYQKAFSEFDRKNYGKALSLFTKFVQKYPDHTYSDNALFWMGEIHFRRNEFGQALSQFERVVREFPEGRKVPDALLRAGSCHLRLSHPDRARSAFERVLHLYPQSVAAQTAKSLIAELQNKGTQRRM